MGGVWPPQGVEPLDPWALPLLNTLILLLVRHDGDVGASRRAARRPEGPRATGLILTILLGVLFSVLQFIEYREALTFDMFKFSGGGIYGAAFFMATGFPRPSRHYRHDFPDGLPVPRDCAAISRQTAISALKPRPGTGTLSTSSGCSCSLSSTCWAIRACCRKLRPLATRGGVRL